MRSLCNVIVGVCGDWWGYIGWTLFLGWLIVPWLTYQSGALPHAWSFLAATTLLWWLIDLLDQSIPLWIVATGLVMLGIGTLPKGGTLVVACWVIYWTRVRE